MTRFDGQIRVKRRPAALARGWCLLSSNRFGRDPYRQAATLLQRSVVLAPVLHSVSRLGKRVTLCCIHGRGHGGLGEGIYSYPAIFPASRSAHLCTNADVCAISPTGYRQDVLGS